MKDTWYADHRDLVKWGTLVHVARRERLRAIVQVPFLRLADRPPLQTGAGTVPIDSEVWRFFREPLSVRDLGERLGVDIVVFDRPFVPRQRKDYRQGFVSLIHETGHPKVVLLDPDTGIAPAQAGPQHVTAADVRGAWTGLSRGDWLIVYQHASRTRGWRQEATSRFRMAIGAARVEEFFADKIASDVVFVGARKD
jgi:hypothetical protein